MERYNNLLGIENTRIIFRNFSGKEGKFNRSGDRNFSVIISYDDAAPLEAEGWNVKWLKPRDEEERPTPYIPVAVRYDFAPPKIYMVTDKGKVLLDEDTVGELDYADISSVDLTLSPYRWQVSGKEGVKAYLKTMYVNIEQDPYADKYSN